MHGLVRCKHERRCSRARRADVSFRDVTIKIPDSGCDQGCEWRHAPEAWAEMWEKWVSWILPRKKKVDFRLLAEARPVALGRCRTWFGVDGKVSIERWYLSPHVEKPFKLKGNKKFRTWTKKSLVFLNSYVIYMWVMDIMNVLRTGMNMSISCIRIMVCYIITSHLFVSFFV